MKYRLYYWEYGMEHINESNNKKVCIEVARKHAEPATVCKANGDVIFENKAQRELNNKR